MIEVAEVVPAKCGAMGSQSAVDRRFGKEDDARLRMRTVTCHPQPIVGISELHTTGPAGERQTYLNLPAWQLGIAIGTKIVTGYPVAK